MKKDVSHFPFFWVEKQHKPSRQVRAQGHNRPVPIDSGDTKAWTPVLAGQNVGSSARNIG